MVSSDPGIRLAKPEKLILQQGAKKFETANNAKSVVVTLGDSSMGHQQELQGRFFGVTNAAIMRLCVLCHTEITGTASNLLKNLSQSFSLLILLRMLLENLFKIQM